MGGKMIALNVPDTVSIVIIGAIGFLAFSIFMQLYQRYVGGFISGAAA